jgi:hypothetical protein
MRGYLQRLLQSQAMPASTASAARPALPSRSPLAERDQRLQVPGLGDALLDAAPPAAPATPTPPGESRTTPSYRSAPAAPQVAREAMPVREPPKTVQRYVAPAPTSAASPAPARSAAPAPATAAPRLDPIAAPAAAPPASVAALPLAPLQPQVTTRAEPAEPEHPPSPPTTHQTVTTRHTLEDVHSVIHHRVELPAPLPASPDDVPGTVPFAASRLPVEAEPPPRIHAPSEVRLPPPKHARELELFDGEPARAVAAPTEVRIRETIRTTVEPREERRAPAQKLPRTAAEASVIGPLPRPDLARVRLELWLR